MHVCIYIYVCIYVYISPYFSFFAFFFKALLVAYGSSQARGQMRAAAASLHHSHSNIRSEPCL